jgi:putative chitinase
LISPAKFAAFAPGAIPGTLAALEAAATKFAGAGMTEPLILAHFLGQLRHESGGFARMAESLNYSVDGLLATFGRHRISEADCRRLGRTATRKADQIGIANLIYGGEWGRENLGNTQAGDGWLFRGSGLIQTTGRANFRAAGYERTPDALRNDIVAAAEAAAGFFVAHGCVAPARSDDVEAVTRKINGGTLGLAERIAATKAAKTLTGAA